MKVRDATAGDLPDIVRIYNHAIETSVATFDLKPFALEDRRDWFAQFGDEHPLLVCESDDRCVAGFAYYLPYRSKPGYAATKETTVYVDPACHHQGIGSALYQELIDRAARNGVHSLMAVLSEQNVASEALHRKFGFKLAGHYEEVGKKFGHWVDTRTFQKLLEPAGA